MSYRRYIEWNSKIYSCWWIKKTEKREIARERENVLDRNGKKASEVKVSLVHDLFAKKTGLSEHLMVKAERSLKCCRMFDLGQFNGYII